MNRMAMAGLYIAMFTVILLTGNRNCIAETVRSLGKPSLQTLALTLVPLNESFSAYVGVFVGPPDTEIEFNGNTLEVSKEREDEFDAFMVNKNDNMDRWITVESTSARETLKLYPNLNYNQRTRTRFVENSCDVGIEKSTTGDRTEYKATVRNCADDENFSKYFIAYIRDESGARVQLSSRDLNDPENKNVVGYYKYLDTYYSTSENSICYAILNYPAMEADGITVESFGFALYVTNTDLFGDDMTFKRSWYFKI